MIKIFRMLLLSVLVMGTISACVKAPSEDTTTPITEPEREELATLIEGGSKKAVIIMQSNGNSQLYDLAVKVQAAVKKLTDVTLEIERDTGTATGLVEILIGDVQRPVYTEAAGGMKTDDYAVVVTEKAIVLAGGSDVSLERSVNYFIKSFLTSGNTTKSDSGALSLMLSSKNNFLHKADYVSDVFTIGNRPIDEFVIVHGVNALPSEIAAANEISAIISKLCGKVLPVVDDRTAPVECEILVGKSNRKETASFNNRTERFEYMSTVTGNKLAFYFSSIAVKEEALTAFSDTLKSKAKDKTIALSDGALTHNIVNDLSKYAVYSEAKLRVMTSNILFSNDLVSHRMENLAATFELYLPDILCLQEARMNVTDTLYPLITDTFTFVDVKTGDSAENYTPILYLQSKYEVVDSGFYRFRKGGNPWSVTYAVFKSRDDGTLFAVCNTHFTTVKEDTPVLGPQYRLEDSNSVLKTVDALRNKYPKIPVFVTGDLNSSSANDVYKNITSKGLNSAMFVATVSDMRDMNTYHSTIGAMPQAKGGAIDHILVSTDAVKVFVHKVLTDKTALEGSDHNPVYADISFEP